MLIQHLFCSSVHNTYCATVKSWGTDRHKNETNTINKSISFTQILKNNLRCSFSDKSFTYYVATLSYKQHLFLCIVALTSLLNTSPSASVQNVLVYKQCRHFLKGFPNTDPKRRRRVGKTVPRNDERCSQLNGKEDGAAV